MVEATIIGALSTFLTTLLVVPVLTPLATKVGLVARPDQRRRHQGAPPAVGGVAILLSLAVFLLVARFTPLFPDLARDQAQGVGLAALVLGAGGVADDLYTLRWPVRLAYQALAAVIMMHVGHVGVQHVGRVFGFSPPIFGRWSELLTLVATVGIINAMNWVDGVDGLAGSIALAATVMLAATAIYAGNDRLAKDLGFVAGALMGFLAYNLRTPWNRGAKVFLGNAGAELLGLLIASACFRLTQNGQHPVGPQLAPFLIAPAVIDCLTLTLRRIRSGVSPFVGDRNHLHHLMLDAGFSPTWVVGLLTAATLVIGATALLAMKAHIPAPWFTVVFVSMWAAYFLATRRRERSVVLLRRFARAMRVVRD